MNMIPKLLLIVLLVLAFATDSRANPVSTTFTSHTVSSVLNNDGGWFGFDQKDVTVSVTAIVDERPTEHLHYKLFLTEIDPLWNSPSRCSNRQSTRARSSASLVSSS